MRILVSGATGYIGGRLVPYLLDRGYEVVCLVRNPEKLRGRPWRDDVTVVTGDVLEPASLKEAFAGCTHAYYLIHSMGGAKDFAETDRRAAANFRDAAENAGLEQLIYLGGLGEEDEDLSNHLASRHEVGRVLAAGSIPVVELRAAVIIGSGSVSFEMLRYLTEVLPIMTTPRWVRTRCQPIAIRDILHYLEAVLGESGSEHHTVYEVGGPNILSYEEMMQTYAKVAGLRKRIIIAVPVLSPRLSSLWIGLVTPLPVGVARPLVDSLEHEVIVTDTAILERHGTALTSFTDAVELALTRSSDLAVTTRWSDASTSPARPFDYDPEWSGGTVYVDRKTVESDAAAGDLFWAFSRIGGEVGYYGFTTLWRIRGLLDTLVGGVGLRRGRRHPEELRHHETVDFWRVARVEPGKRLQLAAEMRLPGDAWLEWIVNETSSGNELEQTAYFIPRGLFGRLYWYVLLPFHGLIFGAMARRIAAAAEQRPVTMP